MANTDHSSFLLDRVECHPTAEQIQFYKNMLSTYQSSYDNFLQHIACRTHPEDFELLSSVLNELEKRTHFEMKRETETADIASSIIELVKEILNEMGSYDESCLQFELLTAGGYFDGTKIYCPDEFDFVVDICDLSAFFKTKSEDEIQIDYLKEDSTRVNVRVIGKPDPAVGIFCEGPCDTDNEENTKESGPSGVIMNKKFANLFTSIFKQVMQSFIEKGLTITRHTGTMQIMPDIVELPHDDSFLPFYALWIPKDGSEHLGISVDVTPSFRLSSDYMHFNEFFVNVDALDCVSERIGKDKCYMRLVLRDDEQWKLSVSHIETELIQTDAEIQRKCSRILKMIKKGKDLTVAQGQQPNAKFMKDSASSEKFTEMCTSYAVKTAVLRHIMSCDNTTQTLGGCFVSVLRDVQETVKAGKFTGYFLGLDKKQSAGTERWETETLKFLTNLNNVIVDILEKREQNVKSLVDRICKEKENFMREIYTSENYEELAEWYIGDI